MSRDFSTRTKLCVSFLKVFAVPGVEEESRNSISVSFPECGPEAVSWVWGNKKLSAPGFLILPEAVKVWEFSQGENKVFWLTVPIYVFCVHKINPIIILRSMGAAVVGGG